MTTIAYKDGLMAADTMMTRGDECVVGAVKIFQTSQFLVGMSGSMSNFLPLQGLFEEYESRLFKGSDLWQVWKDAPDYGGGFCALIVDEDGDIWNAIDGPPVLVPSAFDAIGTGSSYAMGAMAAGLSAADAVEIAMKFDCNTGGNVVTRSLRG